MSWEYVAIFWKDPVLEDAQYLADRARLLREGWEEHIRAPAEPVWDIKGGACIMRRLKDEPLVHTAKTVGKAERLGRLWTRVEIEEIARATKGSVLNESVMQADLIGSLERCNAELQAAINEVYATSKRSDVRGPRGPTLRAVRRCLRPLATKEKLRE